MLLGVAVWMAFRLTNSGQSSWRGAIVLGLLVAGLLFLQNLNDWPLWSASYDTNASYKRLYFGKDRGRGAAIAADRTDRDSGVAGGGTAVPRFATAAAATFKSIYVARITIERIFSSAVVGLSMAAAHIGYVVVFYVVVQRYFGLGRRRKSTIRIR